MAPREFEWLDETALSARWRLRWARRGADLQPVLVRLTRDPAVRLSDLEREARFLRAHRLAGLPSPVGVVELDDGVGLVVTDRGLRPLVRRLDAGPLDLDVALSVAVGACRMLMGLHARDLLHGTPDPVSLLVGESGEDVETIEVAAAGRSPMDPQPVSDGLLAGGHGPYLAPEQTGRVGRLVDERADLYALGATLFTAVTGRPPFASRDARELIHSHIARVPDRLVTLSPLVPEPVSDIVARLLEKDPDDRYQSASGLLHDLETCRAAWRATGSIAPFVLGSRDVGRRLRFPSKLYGRDATGRIITRACETALAGRATFLLVSGYSGVGKTSAVRAFCRPLVRDRGYFIEGKFDAVARTTPYGALVKALGSLLRQVLAGTDDQVAECRRALAEALGANGGVLTAVVPDAEFVLGPQPAVPDLDAAESQNRFRLVLTSVIATFARPDQPLVIFLDDLQWADGATLALLDSILDTPDLPLLLVGACRDNEMTGDHPLWAACERLTRAGAAVLQASLEPLDRESLRAFVGDTLLLDGDAADALADLVRQRTDGNPFLTIQFLEQLRRQGLLTWDGPSQRWRVRPDDIAAATASDDMAQLIVRRIRQMPPGAQTVLQTAACLGATVQVSSLRVACGEGSEADASAIEAGIEAALQAGLLLATDDTLTFLHDRVQRAAYELMEPLERQRRHRHIGDRLLAASGGEVPDDRVFEIVNQLNLGYDPAAARDRRTLARLNLAAGRTAKRSGAYADAIEYFRVGLDRMDPDGWQADHALTFALQLERAECLPLAGDDEATADAHAELLARAATAHDRASVHELRVTFHEKASRFDAAIAACRDGLEIYGVRLPESDAGIADALARERQEIEVLLGGRTIASLADAPVMADESMRRVMRLLTLGWAPVYISGAQPLTSLISATMVRLSLRHGNTEDSAYGYVTHAMTVGPIQHDFGAAWEWGQLALAVNERLGDRRWRARIHQQIHAHVKLWRQPFESCLAHAREARRSGLEAGDLTYAGYGAATESWPAVPAHRSLPGFVRDFLPSLDFLARIGMGGFRDAQAVLLTWALALQGRTENRRLSGHLIDEHAFRVRHGETAPLFMGILRWARLHLAVLFEDLDAGVAAAEEAWATAVPGTQWPVLDDAWGALALAAAWDGAPPDDRVRYAQRVRQARADLAPFAESCPENFRGFLLLVSGELARIEGRDGEAQRLFEEALADATATDHVQQMALAAELAGRGYVRAGRAAEAGRWLRIAYRHYADWGATAKLDELETRYGAALLGLESRAAATLSSGEVPGSSAAVPVAAIPSGPAYSALDVTAVLHVARAIAGEVEREGLVRTLMTLALENAGAARGVFLHLDHGTLVPDVDARVVPGGVDLRRAVTWDDVGAIVDRVARYVWRTGQDVIVADLGTDERFARWAHDAGARSVLCVPVAQQRRTNGILYLENALAGTFTAARIEIVRVSAAQTAIALENARLYEDMKGEIARRTDAEHALRIALAEVEALKNRLEAENVYLQEEIRTEHNFEDIVGSAPSLLQTLRAVERIAPTHATVLILGETGTGKELVARAIHNRSARSGRPLVKLNCGAISPGLVESELFGHVKGAFTGAVDRRIGRFELANGGTIFLDEVGELPLDAQVKLLRVLQEQEFEAVGSDRTVKVDVRVIAATNRDLGAEVAAGRFRADLYYRLNVLQLRVPPLRERREDIAQLTAHFVQRHAKRFGLQDVRVAPESLARLTAYDWPGNVRELENVVERALVLARGGTLVVDAGILPTVVRRAVSEPNREVPAPRTAGTLEDVERAHIAAVLADAGWVIEGPHGAARRLDLNPSTLRSRMKKLGVTRTPTEG